MLRAKLSEMKMTSIVLTIGLVVGALCGVVLNGVVGDLALAIIAGFIATIIGSIVTNVAMVRLGGREVSRTPLVATVFAAVASLGGSAVAVEIATHSHHLMSTPVWIGALAGLFSVILMAILMIAYDKKPAETDRSPKKET
jgi:hypothetical protein